MKTMMDEDFQNLSAALANNTEQLFQIQKDSNDKHEHLRHQLTNDTQNLRNAIISTATLLESEGLNANEGLREEIKNKTLKLREFVSRTTTLLNQAREVSLNEVNRTLDILLKRSDSLLEQQETFRVQPQKLSREITAVEMKQVTSVAIVFF